MASTVIVSVATSVGTTVATSVVASAATTGTATTGAATSSAATGAMSGATSGSITAMLLSAQRFEVASRLGANVSEVRGRVADAMAWASGEITFFRGLDGSDRSQGRRRLWVEEAWRLDVVWRWAQTGWKGGVVEAEGGHGWHDGFRSLAATGNKGGRGGTAGRDRSDYDDGDDGDSGDELPSPDPVESGFDSLLNILTTLGTVLGAIVTIQLLVHWLWRHRVNQRYYAVKRSARLSLNHETIVFRPFPSVFVLPGLPLLGSSIFATGLAGRAASLLADSSAECGWVG